MKQVMEIAHGSKAYGQACTLRNAELRLPLGLNLFDEDLDVEAKSRHFGIFDDEIVIGCLVIAPIDSSSVQLRQMVVDKKYRDRGLGRLLVEAVERRLIESGILEIRLHARIPAMGFYERLGFRVEGNPFLEVSISHQAMRKSIG